jgi:DNA-binding NarL/FixJ family response regulator
LKEDQFKPIVIVLSNYSSRQYRRKCLQSGARFFFDKSAEFHKVAEVLRSLTGILVDFAQAGAAALDVEMTQHRGRAVPALVVDSAGGEHWDEPLSGFDRIEVSVASGD